jgi:hypothetical protein
MSRTNRFIADGTRIIGVVYNNAVIGEVLSSRYYGKRLIYSVKLDTPISLRWRTEPVTEVLLDNKQIKAAPL